ncbi:MAG: chitobiase/beta-hexosaminidase C-terminal domain-containing protein [Saprospiraceae bacterium]|nr:chitobiase/beta-hexosaminidase C-terminal domain-containing protein [Saprospiraceae bacterium]
MQLNKNLIHNTLFFANCFLVFILAFESKLNIPPYIQILGRMHPVVLHFPIVLIIGLIVWNLFFNNKYAHSEIVQKVVLNYTLITAFLTTLTAIFGIFLSKEAVYEADGLERHQWLGFSTAIWIYLGIVFQNHLNRNQLIKLNYNLFLGIYILLAAHYGGEITHGKDYILAPILSKNSVENKSITPESTIYEAVIQPIFDEKCVGCHNEKKAKGELVLINSSTAKKGGKNGQLWGKIEEESLLLKCLGLPMEDKKHMPPLGKPQLEKTELNAIELWVKSGGDFNQKISSLTDENPLKKLIDKQLAKSQNTSYTFAALPEKTIEKLNNNYRIVYKLAENSPAVVVEYYNTSQFNSASLQELSAVKEQLVSLNLNKIKLDKTAIQTIADFPNLTYLNVAFTGLEGDDITALSQLKSLNHLVLSGNKISPAALQSILHLPKLEKLYLWNTGISAAEINQFKLNFSKIQIENGYNGDTTVLKLTPPILENEEQIILKPFPLNLKHYVNGVEIRYTTDGTEPDSVHSKLYNNDVTITQNTNIKSKAFKKGWLPSDVLISNFYAVKFKPDTIIHIQKPDVQYDDKYAKAFFNLKKGEKNFRSGNWVAYRFNPMESMLIFNQPIPLSSLAISHLVDIGSYIMPPQSIELWGGMEQNKLKKIKTFSPKQPSAIAPPYLDILDIKMATTNVRFLKVKVNTVTKLPAWHLGKGDKGWVFIDEIFLN